MKKLIITSLFFLIISCSFKQDKLVSKDANIIASLYLKYDINYLNLDSVKNNKLFINNQKYTSEKKLLVDYKINTEDWKSLKQVLEDNQIESITRIEKDFLFITASFNGSFVGYWKTARNPIIKTNLDAVSYGNYIVTSSKKIDEDFFEVDGSW